MKKLLKNFLMMWAVLLSAGALMTSCSEDDVTTPGGGGTGSGGGSGQSVVNLTWSESETEVSDYGVKIVAGVTSTNQIKFECIPGDYTKSYRLDVIPLAKVYDMIYGKYSEEILNGKRVTDEESKAFLKELLFSEGGSGGFTFSSNSPDAPMDDYWTGHEFNWGADGYSQFEIVPNADYLVIAVGCEDENGANGRDMTILHLETSSLGLNGDPSLEVTKLQTGWSAFGVTFKANEDAKYYYVITMLAESYDNYIKFFGKEMFRDVIRFSALPTSTDDPTGLFMSAPIWDDPKKEIIVLTVGTDENYVPGDIGEYRFFMPLVPENTDPASATITWDQENTSASVVNFDITCDKYTRMVCYRYMEKSTWETTYKNDSVKLAELAYELFDQGWVEYNKNFKFGGSVEEGNLTPIGEGSTFTSNQYILTPNTEYVLAYVAVNGFEQYSEVKSIEFKSDPLNKTNFPGKCNLDVDVKASVSNVILDFKPDENVSMFYHFLVDEKKLDWDWNKDLLYEDLMNSWYNFAYPDQFKGDEEATKDHLQFSYEALQPGTKYYLLYVAEDWDGGVSEPKILEINTLSLQAGDNPRLAIEAKSFYNEIEFCDQLDVTFKPLQDVGLYYYGVFDGLLSEHPSTYKDAEKYWTNLVLNGPDGAGNNFIAYSELTQNVPLKFFGMKDPNLKYKVAAAIPFGANDKQGELSLVYYDIDEDRVITDLTELWDDAPVPVASAKINSSVPMPRKRTQEPYKSIFKTSVNNNYKKTNVNNVLKLNMVNQKFDDYVKTLN